MGTRPGEHTQAVITRATLLRDACELGDRQGGNKSKERLQAPFLCRERRSDDRGFASIVAQLHVDCQDPNEPSIFCSRSTHSLGESTPEGHAMRLFRLSYH